MENNLKIQNNILKIENKFGKIENKNNQNILEDIKWLKWIK